MKVMIFGATGMIGQGVMRECLLDPDITKVLAVDRKATRKSDPKLEELVHADFFDFAPIKGRLAGYDACFFCLGISSAGMSEQDYHRTTYEIPLAVASALVEIDPQMTFIYLSGGGSDSSEQGRVMWARVKGEAENAVQKMPFAAKYAFRPGFVQPMAGVSTQHNPFRALYKVLSPIYPLLKLSKGFVTSTDRRR